jgi:uncharacterized protein DUF3987
VSSAIRLIGKSPNRNGKVYTIPPSLLAKEAIRKYHNALIERRRKEWRDINSFVARWHEQAWRILVVLHAAVHGDNAHLTQIEQEQVDAAIEFAEWFGREQLRLLASMRDEADQVRLEKLIDVVTRSYKGKATLRDLHRRNCYKREEVERLCSKFPDQIAILRSDPGEKGGRPGEFLQVLTAQKYE